ncbi:DUF1620-domain-containing protein [Meredithblackwellia eburnea MCA 4105]
MRLSQSVTALLGLLVSAATPTSANDFHLALIGSPLLSSIPANPPLTQFRHIKVPGDNRKRSIAVTLTDSNVLTAIDPALGSLVWRHHYQQHELPQNFFVCGESLTVISPTSIASLALYSGAVKWSISTPSEEGSTATDALCWDENKEEVIVLSHRSVTRIGKSGKIEWTWETPGGQTPLRLSRISDSQLSVLLLSDNSLTSQLLYSLTGQPLSSISLKASPPASTLVVIPSRTTPSALTASVGPTIAWLDLSTGTIKTTFLGAAFSPISSFSPSPKSAIIEIKDVGLRESGIFIALKEDGTSFAFGAEAGTIKVLWEFREKIPTSLFSGFVDREGDEHIGFLTFSSTLGLANLQVLSLKPTPASDSGMVTGYTFPYDPSQFGSFRSFAIEVAPSEDYRVQTRTLLGTSFGAVQSWTGSKLMWSREEGLASTGNSGVRPVVLDPPERHQIKVGELGVANEGFVDRVGRQLRELDAKLTGKQIAFSATGASSAPHQDLIILASSRARSIFAVDAARNGSIAWRSSVLEEDQPGDVTWTKLSAFDDRNGREVVKAEALVGDGGKRVFYFDARKGARIDDSEVESVVEGELPPLTEVKRTERGLVGLKNVGDVKVPLWTFTPPVGEGLDKVVPQQFGAIASLGRVLGNRTTLLKLLNPHLVATTSLRPSSHSATLSLVDTATGALVFQTVLQEVEGEVDVVLHENWLVATHTLEGDVARSTRIISIELYQEEGVKDTITSSLKTTPTSVRVLSRTYASLQHLKVVGMTSTKLGITSKSAIFLNSKDQIVIIPRKILDTRRVIGKPSKDDQEEMLMPYEAVIPANPLWVASHLYPLAGINKVLSAPGLRESESLVFGYGLDIFSTRQSPSKSFDVLSPSFNKFQLVFTLTILTVALVVTRSMYKSQKTKQKWYSE